MISVCLSSFPQAGQSASTWILVFDGVYRKAVDGLTPQMVPAFYAKARHAFENLSEPSSLSVLIPFCGSLKLNLVHVL
jgi:hypothetical protein